MASTYESKHGIVSKSPEELFMVFTDLRNFTSMLPANMKNDVTADYDNIAISVQGFKIAIKVDSREPYSCIRFSTTDSPLHFSAAIHFDRTSDPMKTDFWLAVDTELNFMMKAMLGGRIKDALDKVVDGLVAASEGRMPEGMPADFDPKNFS